MGKAEQIRLNEWEKKIEISHYTNFLINFELIVFRIRSAAAQSKIWWYNYNRCRCHSVSETLWTCLAIIKSLHHMHSMPSQHQLNGKGMTVNAFCNLNITGIQMYTSCAAIDIQMRMGILIIFWKKNHSVPWIFTRHGNNSNSERQTNIKIIIT